jgi:hypothetical protein
MGRKIFVILVSVLAIGLSLVATSGYAEFYRWVDENGTTWLTDDPVKLPRGSKGEFERVTAIETTPGSQGEVDVLQGPARVDPGTRSSERFIKARKKRDEERKRLESTISTLEEELAVAQGALRRVSLTDRRGYWFVIDPQTGKRDHASYKDPGAIWSTQTWPAVPRAARTKESEERRRIQTDIARIQGDLDRKRQELFTFSKRF